MALERKGKFVKKFIYPTFVKVPVCPLQTHSVLNQSFERPSPDRYIGAVSI
jgi:hypothetical protein